MNPFADITNIGFLDTETRAEKGTSPNDANVKTAGTYRYTKNSYVIISTFALGERPVFDVSLDRGFDGDWLCWDEMPVELREFHKRVEQREAWYAAFNAGFDRNAWNNGTYDFPRLEPDMIIDIMAQATASNLPPSLEGAAKSLGLGGKHPDGSYLINMFCGPDGKTPSEEPQRWEDFKFYGRMDTDLMRDIYRRTRALSPEEWQDYFVSEKINERGIGIDLPTAARAARIAAASSYRDGKQLARWTNGQITAVTQANRIAEWLYEQLPTEAAMLLVSEWDEGEAEDDLVVGKLSLERDRIGKLVAYFDALEKKQGLTEREQVMRMVVETRQYGGSTSPGKFQKMLDQHDGGKLKGQYVFNGAQQTGRFSSKGVQVHNLTRSSLNEFEAAAIEMINELEV